MIRKTDVVCVAYDAGSASALIPVVRELQRRGISSQAIVGGPAITIWRRDLSHPPILRCSDSFSLTAGRHILQQSHAKLLLSGAGLYNQLEHTIRLAARSLHRPVVAVLDAGVHYRERFERISGQSRVYAWPDLICLPAESMRQEMLKVGFIKNQLAVTGFINLEASVAAYHYFQKSDRQLWRSRMALKPGERVGVFFSEPFYCRPKGRPLSGPGGLMDAHGRSLYGYTSESILDSILTELVALCESQRRYCTLIVKPHPNEYVPRLKAIVSRWHHPFLRVKLESEGKAAQWIARCDFALGMFSTALLEAALAGRPSLSVQIGLPPKKPDPCQGNVLGYTQAIFTRSALKKRLSDVLSHPTPGGKSKPKPPLVWKGAARRTAEQVISLLRKAPVLNIVHGPRLLIRPFDSHCITTDHIRWLNNRESLRYSSQRFHVHTYKSCRAYLRSFEGTPNFYWTIRRRKDDRAIGTMNAYIDPQSQAADVGILIGDFKGKGFGKEAWGLALRFLFERHYLQKVTAHTLAPNKAMIQICRGWGMKRESVIKNKDVINQRPVHQLVFGLTAREWFAAHP